MIHFMDAELNKNHPLPVHNFHIKKLKSLLAIVENSAKGDNYLFRNLYVNENSKESDILEDGHNSCGVFVSWILLTIELIGRPHATVYATEKDMMESGWHLIKELKPGAIIIWEPRTGAMFDGQKIPKEHIGFYVGNNEAISNDSKNTGFPRRHHATYGAATDGTPVRKIEKIYWHSDLNNG